MTLAARKIPQARVIDVTNIPSERFRLVKEQILLGRIKRIYVSKLLKAKELAWPLARKLQMFMRMTVRRLMALEKYYEQMKSKPVGAMHALGSEAVRRMLDEANEFMKQEKFIDAEKRLIEVVSHDARNIDAYEMLGNLYVKTKRLDEAKETFGFVLKMDPNDASVLTSLGEIVLGDSDARGALEYFEHAIAKRPNNPKYLDFYVTAALAAGEIEKAREGIDRLRSANPENQKLVEFEEKLSQLFVGKNK